MLQVWDFIEGLGRSRNRERRNVNKPVFVGSEEMVAMLDHAVAKVDVEQVTESVKAGLCRLIREKTVVLSDELTRPEPGCYARRLLYQNPDLRYEVIAMIWGPGQGTPLHDHAGIWCVDGVLEGEVEVTQYDMLENRGDLFRFQPQKTIVAGVGSAGSLIPPFEYHTIFNHRSDPSITIHVYGGKMDCCTIFEARQDGWFERRQKNLSYSS